MAWVRGALDSYNLPFISTDRFWIVSPCELGINLPNLTWTNGIHTPRFKLAGIQTHDLKIMKRTLFAPKGLDHSVTEHFPIIFI